jgi:hypothetical protein
MLSTTSWLLFEKPVVHRLAMHGAGGNTEAVCALPDKDGLSLRGERMR